MPDVGEVLTTFPTSQVDQDNLAYYTGLVERRLLLDRCASCGRWHHPPRPLCPHCWSTEVEHVEVSGRGVVVLALGMPSKEGIDTVVTVQLDEDPELRFTSRVVENPAPEPSLIGRRADVVWVETDGAPDPRFRLLPEDAQEGSR